MSSPCHVWSQEYNRWNVRWDDGSGNGWRYQVAGQKCPECGTMLLAHGLEVLRKGVCHQWKKPVGWMVRETDHNPILSEVRAVPDGSRCPTCGRTLNADGSDSGPTFKADRIVQRLLSGRVTIRRPTNVDVRFVYELLSESLMVHSATSRVWSYDEAVDWCTEQDDCNFRFIIVWDGIVAGLVSVEDVKLPSRRHIMLAMAPDFRAHPFGITIVGALLAMLECYRLEKTHKFGTEVRADNKKSIALQEGLLIREGVFRQECYDPAGRLQDVHKFGLLTETDIIPFFGCTFKELADAYFGQIARKIDGEC